MTTETQALTVQKFSTRMPDGPVLAVEIRSGDDSLALADVFADTVAEIRESLDVTTIERVDISGQEDLAAAEQRSLIERRTVNDINARLKPISDVLFAAHRAVTGARAELAQFATDREAKYDAAIKTYRRDEKKRLDDLAREQTEAIRQAEEDRKAAELAELDAQKKKTRSPEKRAQLEEAAQAVAARPIDDPVMLAPKLAPTTKGFGVREVYEVTVLDEERFITAIGRFDAFMEVAMAIERDGFGGKKLGASDVARMIRALANDVPRIPTLTVKISEAEIKNVAKLTRGKAEFPGVVITKEEGTTKRAR